MSRKKELAKNTAILTIGKICTQSISFLLLPLYTYILSTEDYGIHDLLVTYATLLLPLVNWQMDQGLFRFLLDRRGNNSEITSLFSTLFASGFFQSILYCILYLFVSTHLNIPYSYFLLLYVILQVFVQLLMQLVRGLGYSSKYAIASFISASTTVCLNVVFLVLFKTGVQGLFFSTLLAQILTLVYLLLTSKFWHYLRFNSIDFNIFKEVSSFSLPLIPNNLAWWVVNASDRSILTWILGASANGIYSVANKFPHVFISFYNILNLSWTETVSLHINDEDRDQFLSEMMTQIFKFFCCACFCIVSALPFVFPFFINKKFDASYNHIIILMYAMIFRVLVGLYSCIYIANKDSKKVAITSAMAAIINISIDLMFVKAIYVYAASLSTFIAFAAMFIIRYIDINKSISVKIDKKVTVSSIVLGVLLLFIYYCNNLYIQTVGLIITVTYSFIINKDTIKTLINFVKKKIKKPREA